MIFSVQKRFLVFLLLPVVLILLVSGVASFLYARSYLLDGWTAMTKLRLEWTAHQIQMRLNSRRELMDLIVKAQSALDPFGQPRPFSSSSFQRCPEFVLWRFNHCLE